jgi:hypothetical protein
MVVAFSGAAVGTACLRAGLADPDDATAAAIQATTVVAANPIPPVVRAHAKPRGMAAADALLLSPRLTIPPAHAPVDAAPKAAAGPEQAATAEMAHRPSETGAAVSRPAVATQVAPRSPAAPTRPHAADAASPAFSPRSIAHIKHALKLRPDQEEYWQPVEAILHDIGRQQRQAAGRDVAPSGAGAVAATIDEERLQRLTSAAFPLIMSLDEAQKREARALAHTMGLDSVASAI